MVSSLIVQILIMQKQANPSLHCIFSVLFRAHIRHLTKFCLNSICFAFYICVNLLEGSVLFTTSKIWMTKMKSFGLDIECRCCG